RGGPVPQCRSRPRRRGLADRPLAPRAIRARPPAHPGAGGRARDGHDLGRPVRGRQARDGARRRERRPEPGAIGDGADRAVKVLLAGLRVVLGLLALAHVVVFAYLVARRLAYPYDLEGMEGGVLR